MGQLAGKVAVVTGASKGIGRGIALAMAREGARVVVSSRTPESIALVVDQIQAEGGTAIGVPCNIASLPDLERLISETVAAFGTINILVNNAQGFGTKEKPTHTSELIPLEDFPEDEWDYTFLTGPVATLRAMKLVFPYMKSNGGGKIINFGSRRGQIGAAHVAAYGAAKEAIRGLSRTAAREWGHYGINVNIINPLVMSNSLENFQSLYPEQSEKTLLQVSMRRYGDPEKDAGGLAVFLASSGSDYITGMTIMLDGGFHMFA